VPTPRDIVEIVEYYRNATSAVKKAATKAQVATIVEAHEQALRNQKRQFKGLHGRRLSGQLFNSQYYGFERDGSDIPTSFLGVRNIPYGRIQEYGSGGLPGGVVKPVKAKKLWIPNYKKAGRMRPREFMSLLFSNPAYYHLFPNMAARWTGNYIAERGVRKKQWEPLFYLKDSVKIPPRPFLTPAVAAAFLNYPDKFAKYLGEELDR